MIRRIQRPTLFCLLIIGLITVDACRKKYYATAVDMAEYGWVLYETKDYLNSNTWFNDAILKDSKWNIECAVGTYNKLNYNIFCFKDVKATDSKVIIFSQNLDLINDETATIYNNVVIIDENKSSLYADKVSYDFENKLYHISMFDQDKNIKIKLIE